MPTPLQPTSDRFATETRFRLVVQVPENDAETLRDAARGRCRWFGATTTMSPSRASRVGSTSAPSPVGGTHPPRPPSKSPASNSRSSCPQIRRWQPA